MEDRLQEGVPECILDFKDAGISVCMLTGDKLETAENIGFSSRIFTIETHVARISDMDNPRHLAIELKELRDKLLAKDPSLYSNHA